MKRDFKRMQEEIMPGRETQDWMWEEIEKKAAAGGEKPDRWAGLKITASIAAAVLLFAVLIPQTSWAEQLRGFLKEFFYTGAGNDGKFQLKDQLVTMFYPVYNSQGIGAAKIASNLETVSYRMSGEKSPS